jgi:predicted nucleic acid-binding protein
MIIVDTGFWLALANEQDHHHQQAQLVIQRLREPLITTWCVVTETCYLLLTRLGNHAQLLFIQNFLAGGFEVFELQSNHVRRMEQLIDRYEDIPMDLADASLVVLAENLGHGRILTSDRRDFSIYRWQDNNTFKNLFLEYP